MQGNSFNSWWYLAPSWHFQNELPVKVVWRFLWKMLSVVLLITLKDISCVTCIENTCQRLLRKQIFAKKKRNLWLYSTSFMLMSSLPRIQHLLLPKIGEVGGTPRNTWLTFLLQQNYSFVSTRGRRSVTKSLWTRLLMYCSKSQSWDLSGTCWWRNVGVRSQKEDSSFSLIRSYHCLSKYSPFLMQRTSFKNTNFSKRQPRGKAWEKKSKGPRIQMCRVNVPPFFFTINVSLRV